MMIRTVFCLTTVVALGLASQAAAESWIEYSRSDRTAYIVNLDTLTPVEGVATVLIARVPVHGDVANLSHETEEVMVRCSDGQSRSGATVTHGADGAETDRYSEDTPWEDTPNGGVYGSVKSFACDDMRPQGQTYPTIPAFIAAGRGQ
jgi:hypothetical protein